MPQQLAKIECNYHYIIKMKGTNCKLDTGLQKNTDIKFTARLRYRELSGGLFRVRLGMGPAT